MSEFKSFKNFNYFGIYISAYTNEKGEVKKHTIQPKKTEYEGIHHYMKKLFNPLTREYIKPNGIQIDTTNLDVIDIDEPDKCPILNKLINDSSFYVKTRKGYHFYYKRSNKIIKDNICCGIVDINLVKLWFVPAYYHNETEEKYSYEIIKNGELKIMPDYAIDWCNTVIMFKQPITTHNKNKTAKKGIEEMIIKPDLIIEKFNLEVMNIIYKIFYENKMFDEYNDWINVAYMGRHINNTEDSFKLFDKYSRKVEKFKNNDIKINAKAFYGKGEYNINFDENGVLLKCMRLNTKLYMKSLQKLYKCRYEDEFKKINSKYIYPDDNSLDYIFDGWMKGFKTLCIKSAYGTGKTYGFKKLLEKLKE